MDAEDLRAEFLKFLTVDINHYFLAKRNQALFDPKDGFAVFTGTSLDMVMDKFDRAVESLGS